jgi:Cu+-exporting ATPase
MSNAPNQSGHAHHAKPDHGQHAHAGHDHSCHAHAPAAGHDSPRQQPSTTVAGGRYTCPMHPEIVRDAPGDCPICGMALVPIAGTGFRSSCSPCRP